MRNSGTQNCLLPFQWPMTLQTRQPIMHSSFSSLQILNAPSVANCARPGCHFVSHSVTVRRSDWWQNYTERSGMFTKNKQLDYTGTVRTSPTVDYRCQDEKLVCAPAHCSFRFAQLFSCDVTTVTQYFGLLNAIGCSSSNSSKSEL